MSDPVSTRSVLGVSPVRCFLSRLAIGLRLALLILLRRPYKLTLLVADGCNLRCQICSIWQRKHSVLTLNEVQQIWAAFPVKPCWINISGGEPTLNPELSGILDFFVTMRRSLMITLTTNGQRNITPVIEQAMRTNHRSVVFVSVSLDGDEAVHDAVRGSPGSFAKATQTIHDLSLLARMTPALAAGLSVTLSNANLNQVPQFVARLSAYFPISLNLAQHSSYYANRRQHHFTGLDRVQLLEALRGLTYMHTQLGLASFLKINYLALVIGYLRGHRRRMSCSSIVSNVLITAELNLVNCSLRFEPWLSTECSRDERMQQLVEVIRAPRLRRRALEKRIRGVGCESHCHTPCEVYVHCLSAMFHPLQAPRLLWVYLSNVTRGWLVKSRQASAVAWSRPPVSDASIDGLRSFRNRQLEQYETRQDRNATDLSVVLGISELASGSAQQSLPARARPLRPFNRFRQVLHPFRNP